MRTVSQDALETLVQAYGLEPVNLITIYWTPTNVIQYADKTITSEIQGKIIELSSFDDVVNFSGNKSSQTFNVVLDDTDGSIKKIYDQNDIHKIRIKVYQWFTNISINDAFLIFDGEINSPIVWKEGDRSLSFAVVSEIEDQEAGFTPEEGKFDLIPDDLVGHAFPLPFGTCLLVPAHKLDPIPVGILLDALGVVDPSIAKQVAELRKKVNELNGLATLAFYAAIEAYLQGFGTGDDYWKNIGDGYTAKGNDYIAQSWKAQQDILNLLNSQSLQGKYAKSSVRVHNGGCFPQGQSSGSTLTNGTQINGQMTATDFQINNVIHPGSDANAFGALTQAPIETSIQVGGNQPIITKLGMVWEPVDQPFKLTTPVSVAYLVCMLHCSVLNVWAYRNYNDTRLLMQVPTEYYSITQTAFGSIPVTEIVLSKPLSYYDSKWDDNLFVDVQSPVGPNTVSVIEWLIENYTTKGIDSLSFGHVARALSGCPSNFCILKEENIVKLLSDIAYQSRCALLLKNDIFYLIFLPEEPPPVDSITVDDIVVNTLEITHSSTENVVTKMTAEYVTTYDGGKPHKIVIRNNTLKYGIQESSTNWLVYTVPGLVNVAVSFWAIRKSNTWKIVKFKTPLHKIRLETFDPVTINIPWVSNAPVTGIIQSVKLDTKAFNLEFEVWLPILLGSMTKYNFAWPPDSDVEISPNELEFQKLGYDATGNLGPQNGATICGPHYNVSKGNKEKVTHPSTNTVDDGVVVTGTPDALDTTVKPNIPYTYNQYTTSPFDPQTVKQGAFPAIIVDNTESPDKYSVKMYLQGFGQNTVGTVATAKDVTKGPKLAIGSWITVLVVVWTKTDPTTGKQVINMDKYIVPIGKSTFIGKIASGTGALYDVDLYEKGKDNPSTQTVSVNQLQIDSSETIPIGTWVIVLSNQKDNGDGTFSTEYTMQVPVYLGD